MSRKQHIILQLHIYVNFLQTFGKIQTLILFFSLIYSMDCNSTQLVTHMKTQKHFQNFTKSQFMKCPVSNKSYIFDFSNNSWETNALFTFISKQNYYIVKNLHCFHIFINAEALYVVLLICCLRDICNTAGYRCENAFLTFILTQNNQVVKRLSYIKRLINVDTQFI